MKSYWLKSERLKLSWLLPLWIISLAIGADFSEAKPRPNTVNVVIVGAAGANTLSSQQILKMFRKTKGRFIRAHNLRLNLLKLKMRPDFYPAYRSLEGRDGLRQWFSYLAKLKKGGKPAVGIVVLPPIYGKDGRQYIAGQASGICTGNFGNAWVNGVGVNNEGRDRYLLSVVSFQHELGHLVGAIHDKLEDPFVMSPYPGPAVDELGYIGFSQVSKLYISECFNYWWRRIVPAAAITPESEIFGS